MTTQEILNATGKTKTWKIEQLLRAGKTRQETAALMNCGYGFVQNVYKNIFPERIRNRQTIAQIIEEFTLTNFHFNHKFGVEIEAYGITRIELVAELRAAGINVQDSQYTHATTPHWKIVSDGSLTGENTFELVSPILEGEQGLRTLKTVCLIVSGLEAKLNKTCGLHIHFDARDFNLTTWKNLFINYAKLEEQIDSFMPRSRRANNNYYCRSMKFENYESKINSVNHLQSLEAGLTELRRTTVQNERYYKLNIQSYWIHKSVEFRQHSGTTKFEKIKNWILFLARMIEFSKSAQLENGNWDSLKRFLPNEIINYYETRKNEL